MSGYIGNIPVPQSTQTRDNFTATSGQTTFSTSGYTPNYLDVYLNGIHLDPSDYTATNGTDVVLGTGATAGDVLEVVAFTTFEAANVETLTYNGSDKVNTTSTGIDVTGTVTADGLTVDGNPVINGTSPQLFLQTGATHYNWQIAAQENVSAAFEISSGSADADATNDTYTKRLVVGQSGDISFYEDTGTTAKFFWDASAESLGIGTSNTNSRNLYIEGAGAYLGLNSTAGGFTTIEGLDNGTKRWRIGQTGFGGADGFAIYTGASDQERMRIDSSGNLLVGTTSSNARTTIRNATGSDGLRLDQEGGTSLYVNNTNATYYAYFVFNGTNTGRIETNGTSTSYVTSSDYRLKTDVQPMTGATERLKALKPVNFEWISSGERVDGFLAHEAQEVVPEAVTGTKDAMRTEEYEVTPAVLDDDGNVVTEAVMGEREVPDYQGIDQSKIVPLLVAAMQEQQTVIEDLKARIEVLEGASA